MIGFIQNIRDAQGVEVLTAERLRAVQASSLVLETAAALRALHRRMDTGTITHDEYKAQAATLKKRLPALTPHATFPLGRRANMGALPTGFVLLDIEEEHLEEVRSEDLTRFIDPVRGPLVWARRSASGYGLQLILRIPPGMTIMQAQAHFAARLATHYDTACHDMARAAFITPADYDLYRDDTALFASRTATAVMAFIDTHAIAPGNRNSTLFAAAMRARHVTDPDTDELTAALLTANAWALGADALPETEVHAIAASAARHPLGQTLLFTGQDTHRTAAPLTHTPAATDGTAHGNGATDATDDTPPEMPDALPPLVSLFTSRVPRNMRAAVANAIFPPLGAHLFNVVFNMYGHERHEATLMAVLMAKISAGKSCVDEPIRAIMEDIDERDAQSAAIEAAWKKECRMRSANRDKPPRPDNIIIQHIVTNITTPEFTLKTKDAHGRFLYAHMNEIDNLDGLGTEKFNIINHAFDYGNRWGQMRVSPEAVSEQVTVRFNFNASTVNTKGLRFFSRDLETGPVSRLSFATISRSVGARPVYGPYDDDFRAALKPYIDNLNAARGTFVIPQADAIARQLDEQYVNRYNSGDEPLREALPALCPRATVIAYLKACVLFIAQGCTWTDDIGSFAQWAYEYDMWCKMRFFGEALHNILAQPDTLTAPGDAQHGPQLLKALPDTFTLADVINARQALGMSTSETTARSTLRTWMHRNIITRNDNDTYTKTKN